MFASKAVIVTGSSAGFGAAIAAEFVKRGANVVLHGRSAEKLQKISDECKKFAKNNQKIISIQGDITNESVQNQLISSAVQDFGKLDILINNAGIFRETRLDSYNFKNYVDIMDTNVTAPVALTVKALQFLKKTKGVVINMSSMAAYRSLPHVSAYCMSKAALDAFTKCVAFESAKHGVRINSINPSPFITDVWRDTPDWLDDAQKSCKDIIPMGRFGEVSELVNAVMFLASSQSSFSTGIIFPIDGGLCANGL